MDIEKKCQWCGKTFIAHSFNARFCSKQCIDTAYKHKERMKKMKEYEVELLKNSDYIPMVSKKNFLTPTEAAKLLGVGRSTFYRYLSSNAIKSRQFRGKTIIRRTDLEKMFDEAPQYTKRKNNRANKPQSELYSTQDIMKKYNIGKKAVIGRCNRYDIPKIYEGRNVFYSRELIHKYFADLKAEYNREDWYSVEEIMEKFNMSYTAVISFVMRHSIPRIKDHEKQRYSPLYSKMHIDSKKGLLGDGTDPDLYTQDEIKEKYNLTKDQLSYILKTYHVERIKVGKLSKIPRKIFDNVMFKHRNGKVLKPEQ